MIEKGKELVTRVFAGKASAAEILAYLESPEWIRHKASREAEDLKRQKAGRARLLDLLEQAKASGLVIEQEIMPLKEGHDSVMVKVSRAKDQWRTTGFPSFFGPEEVEEAFAHLTDWNR